MKKKTQQNSEWRADEKFLTFLFLKFQVEIGDPNTIVWEAKDFQLNLHGLLNFMRNDAETGRELYDSFYSQLETDFKLTLKDH